MSDPTPFTEDPLDAEGVDPDLSQDRDDKRTQSPGADVESPEVDGPDDRGPTHDERL
ncbi:hypothetical protein WDU99_15470 [Microbacterium sp. Mu-80]|uniref:Sugar ABC transporter ATPase n=1 Tax=Microbacterium bandirmense TaxID=3122050 RepID=A0ABU8LEG4_9MICO